MGKTKDLSRRFLTRVLCFAAMMTASVLMLGCFALQVDAATAKITGSTVNIRKEASTSSEAVGSAKRGDSFTIQREVTGSDGYVWYQITANNQLGYIRSDLAEKSNEEVTPPAVSTEGVTEVQPISAKVTGNLVRVRPDASTNGSVITTVAKDAVVTVNGTAAGADGKIWYLINFRSDGGEVTGFIREDYLSLSGELKPVEQEPPQIPPVEEPATDVPDPTVTVKDFETFQKDGKWYLVDNTGEESLNYVIADIFKAAETNAQLYKDSLKTVRTQKVFLVILVLLLVAGGVGATLIIFKMRDMMDEAYFEEVEREVVSKRQNKQPNVMHTVGKDSVQKKPTVNGQQRPVTKPQQVSGQPRQMPKQQTGAQPRPNTTAQNSGAQVKQPVQTQPSMSQSRPGATAQSVNAQTSQPVRPQNSEPMKQVNPAQGNTMQAKPETQQPAAQKPAAQQPAAQKPAAQQPAAQKPATQQPAQKPAAQPAGNKDAAKPANAKANQEWKSKNFMADDDDDFEFEFLNWDGDDDL